MFDIYVTRDFEHMSEVAANIVIGKIKDFVPTEKKSFLNFILPTGNTPTGMYKKIIEKQDTFDSSTVISHNLDEYIGLPRETITERVIHPESYGFFMIKNFFGGLEKPFHEWHVPRGCEIEQNKLEKELSEHPEAYCYKGVNDGKKGLAIDISKNSDSDYLNWIKNEILDSYLASIKKHGKVDLSIVGVGGRGHIAFHESGIPLNLEMLLVKLDENTVENAVADGHFSSKEQSPRYAVSLGAGFVYNIDCNNGVLLIANGERKISPINEALFGGVSELVPISGCQKFSGESGKSIWVLDEIAATDVLSKSSTLEDKGISITDLRREK